MLPTPLSNKLNRTSQQVPQSNSIKQTQQVNTSNQFTNKTTSKTNKQNKQNTKNKSKHQHKIKIKIKHQIPKSNHNTTISKQAITKTYTQLKLNVNR